MITENKGQINQIIGKAGEDAACEFMKNLGFRIVHRNYRIGYDEIDIIAENDEKIVFVEVKTRTEVQNNLYGRPCLAINQKKRWCVARCAQKYLKYYNPSKKPCRIDVIEVLIRTDKMTGKGCYKINHIPNAFGAGGKII